MCTFHISYYVYISAGGVGMANQPYVTVEGKRATAYYIGEYLDTHYILHATRTHVCKSLTYIRPYRQAGRPDRPQIHRQAGRHRDRQADIEIDRQT